MFCDPATSTVRANSSKESVKPKSADAMIPGFMIGSVMCQKVRQLLAPRHIAASSVERSKRLNTVSITMKQKGKVQRMWTGSVVPSQCLSMPMPCQNSAWPRPTVTPGIMMPTR